MKAYIPESLIDEIKDEVVFDFNFDNNKRVNTGIFCVMFTMKDNTRHCAGWYTLQLKGLRKEILN
jgi:hypothetical protein